MINFFRKKRPLPTSEQVEKIRAHILVSGKVQGVFYRENTRKRAEKLRVTGWVKNLKNGRVEAIFEGGKDNVENMVNWARKGPIWAKIEALDVIWEDYRGEFNGFDIKRDL